MSEGPSRFLQENLLVLLCFDAEYAPIIVNNVDPNLFDNAVYREIANQGIKFYKRYNEPVKDHLPDLLEDVVTKKDAKAELYLRAIKSIYEMRNKVNKGYVKDQLESFVKTQKLKQSIMDAANHLQKGELEKAELALEVGRKGKLGVFDPGVRFGVDVTKTLAFLDSQIEVISTGIKSLDHLSIGPVPKELMVFIAPKGRGKSWFLINLCKWAIIQRKRILYISLEMSELRVMMRFIQSIFGLPKRSIGPITVPIFKTDEYGSFLEMEVEKIVKEKSLADPGIKKWLQTKLKTLRRPKLIVKEFPTGQLTIPALRAYIGNLQDFYNFTPDLLVIDYIDLMKMDLESYRLNLGQTYIELRGLGVEFNMAVVTPSQSNRAAEDAKLITSKYLAEDYSKGMTADTVISYNQTQDEKKIGLARLYIDKSRNEEDGRIVMVSQAYSIGQFCLSSSLIPRDYESVVVNKLLKEERLDGKRKGRY